MGRFALIGGYTFQDPKVRDRLLNPDFRTRYFIVGGEWFFAKNGKVYSESKIDLDSVTADGRTGLQRVYYRLPLRLLMADQPSAVSTSAIGMGLLITVETFWKEATCTRREPADKAKISLLPDRSVQGARKKNMRSLNARCESLIHEDS